jgi:hypothetical protein
MDESPPGEARIPAMELVCSGTPYEMGLAQGKVAGEQIGRARKCLARLDAFRLEQPWWLPYRVFRVLAESRSKTALVPTLARSAPEMLQRLQGIADGARLPLRSLCLMNAFEALLSSIRDRTTSAPIGGCSAVAVRGNSSIDGEPIIARNFDYLPLLEPFYMLRESRPANGFRSLDFFVAPQAGTVDGVNEKGLCITLNYAFLIEESPPGPLITMLIAEALAKCASVPEAVRHISARERWGGGILMLADASGDIASLELSPRRMDIRRPKPQQDRLVHTNVCVGTQTRALQVPDSEVFSDRVPLALRGKPVLQWHADRARRIEQRLGTFQKLGPAELEQILSDHGPTGVPDGASPCVHTEYWRTTATLQWFPAKRSVRVSYGLACNARFREFRLE